MHLLDRERFTANECNFHQARSQDAAEGTFVGFAGGSMNDAKVCFAIPNLFFRSFAHYLVLRSLFSIINRYQASMPFENFLLLPSLQYRCGSSPFFRLSSDAFSSYSDGQTSEGIKYGSQPSMPNHD